VSLLDHLPALAATQAVPPLTFAELESIHDGPRFDSAGSSVWNRIG
jgi:hypothetical protein